MQLRYTPPPQIRAALWLMMNIVSAAVTEFRTTLGIGPGGFKPFLQRDQIATLQRYLAQAEPMVRRFLFLAAMELGALPALVRAPSAGPQKFLRRTDTPARGKPSPRFRLLESTGRHTPHAAPPPPLRLTGPSIRRLDLPYTPDLREYPQHPDDILPARMIVRRLLALEDALDNRARYITAMRKHLGAALRTLKSLPPRLYTRGPLTYGQQCAARLIAEEVSDLQHSLDTS